MSLYTFRGVLPQSPCAPLWSFLPQIHAAGCHIGGLFLSTVNIHFCITSWYKLSFLPSDWLNIGSCSVHPELSEFLFNQHWCFNMNCLSLRTNENTSPRTTLYVLGGRGGCGGRKVLG